MCRSKVRLSRPLTQCGGLAFVRSNSGDQHSPSPGTQAHPWPDEPRPTGTHGAGPCGYRQTRTTQPLLDLTAADPAFEQRRFYCPRNRLSDRPKAHTESRGQTPRRPGVHSRFGSGACCNTFSGAEAMACSVEALQSADRGCGISVDPRHLTGLGCIPESGNVDSRHLRHD